MFDFPLLETPVLQKEARHIIVAMQMIGCESVSKTSFEESILLGAKR